MGNLTSRRKVVFDVKNGHLSAFFAKKGIVAPVFYSYQSKKTNIQVHLLATRELLSPGQRIQFTEIPSDITTRDIARYYTFNSDDLKAINSCRRAHNRLGFAVQLCYLKFPGRVWELGEKVPKPVLSYIALQLDVKSKLIKNYALRDTTRREHLAKIQKVFE